MKYRQQLPQLGTQLFLTDGGLETTLIFHQGVDLPFFASFDLLSIDHGKQRIVEYYESYIQFARDKKLGFILESPTWRANPDWAKKMGYTTEELAALNREAINIMAALRTKFETQDTPLVISGCIGPRGDGYQPGKKMSVAQARDYHREQVNVFADSHADLISAMTINYVDEAIGIVQACKDANMPVVISFTTETDGRLPDGTSLQAAIATVEDATDAAPAYYMINCAHPDHFSNALEPGADWVNRVRAVRANASRLSHAELDDSVELDRGNPEEFGKLYRQLRKFFPQLTALGGCCGTDLDHIKAIHHHCCT